MTREVCASSLLWSERWAVFALVAIRRAGRAPLSLGGVLVPQNSRVFRESEPHLQATGLTCAVRSTRTSGAGRILTTAIAVSCSCRACGSCGPVKSFRQHRASCDRRSAPVPNLPGGVVPCSTRGVNHQCGREEHEGNSEQNFSRIHQYSSSFLHGSVTRRRHSCITLYHSLYGGVDKYVKSPKLAYITPGFS